MHALAFAALSALAISATAAAQAAVPAPESESAAAARGVVARAKALFAVGDYGAALAEFQRAHELLEGDPRQGDVLNNIAVCYERMFRYDLALQSYERYLREGGAGPEDRAEVEAVMRSLRDLLGSVRITGTAGAEAWMGDRKLGELPVEVLVPAGVYVLEVRARGHEPVRRELRVAARATERWHAVLEPVPSYRGLPRTYFWTGTALTAAALITGAAFGVAALSESAEGEDRAERGLKVEREPTRDLALKADIAFIAAGVLGAGSALLFFLTDWSSGDGSEHEDHGRTPSLQVVAAPGALSLQFGGAVP